jgi:hypothetical protein
LLDDVFETAHFGARCVKLFVAFIGLHVALPHRVLDGVYRPVDFFHVFFVLAGLAVNVFEGVAQIVKVLLGFFGSVLQPPVWAREWRRRVPVADRQLTLIPLKKSEILYFKK